MLLVRWPESEDMFPPALSDGDRWWANAIVDNAATATRDKIRFFMCFPFWLFQL